MIEKKKMGCLFFEISLHLDINICHWQSKPQNKACTFMTSDIRKKKGTTYMNISFRKSEMSKRKGIQNSTWNLLTVDNSKVPLVCSHFYCEQIIFLIMQTSEEDDSLTWFPWLEAILGFCRHINTIINTKCQN